MREVDNYDLYQRKSDSMKACTKSVSSNPQYSKEEEEEKEEKEKFKLTPDDKLVVASFKLPLDIVKDPDTDEWSVT